MARNPPTVLTSCRRCLGLCLAAALVVRPLAADDRYPVQPAGAIRLIEPRRPESAPTVAEEPPAQPVPAPTVAGLVADRLAGAGARFAFMVPGESFLPLLESLPAAGIRVVAARHEGGAAFMAAAAAHRSDQVRAASTTRRTQSRSAAPPV